MAAILPLVWKPSDVRRLASGDTLLTQASTSAAASLNTPVGSNPTIPNDGDLWYNGTNLYFRAGAVNKDLLNPTVTAVPGFTRIMLLMGG